MPLPDETWQEAEECFELEDSQEERTATSIADEPDVVEWVKSVARELRDRLQAAAPIGLVNKELAIINSRLEKLKQEAPLVIPIQSLAPEPYEVTKPMLAVVRIVDGEYIASFVDANLGSSGETLEEAILNLKDAIAAGFDVLASANDSELGPGPLQQKRTLEEFIRRKQ
jgi:predicted RNase H-like HicB family nuclease